MNERGKAARYETEDDSAPLDTHVARAILDGYHDKVSRALQSDVVIVGAGPSGLVAAWRLAHAGRHVVLLDKRLSPGGGIWGGSLGMNEVVVEQDAFSILAEAGVRQHCRGDLFVADAAELACALCLKALHAGVVFLNLITAEDVCVHDGRVNGVAVNRSILGERLPIDPLVLRSRAVIDATGHEAVLADRLHRRGLIDSPEGRLAGEGPMDAAAGEQFVVANVMELFPGLWVSGMSVCAVMGGPRMGPIFGGMLLSGEKAGEMIDRSLAESDQI